MASLSVLLVLVTLSSAALAQVPSGATSYTISAMYMPKINQRVPPSGSQDFETLESAFVRVTVTEHDLTDLTIVLTPAAEVHGRVIFEKGDPPATGPRRMGVRGGGTSRCVRNSRQLTHRGGGPPNRPASATRM